MEIVLVVLSSVVHSLIRLLRFVGVNPDRESSLPTALQRTDS